MRNIAVSEINEAVAKLCIQANISLRRDVLAALKRALKNETNARARNIIGALIENAQIALKKNLPICQDTGMASVFLEIGRNVKLIGGDLEKAINEGVRQGYKKGLLRKSVVGNPLARTNTKDNTPAVIHTEIIPGDKIEITVLPKGFGCENKARLEMFNPTAGICDVKKFIIDAVKSAGPDACPPFVVGVGIGGTADYAMYLAKKALLRKLSAKRYPLLESDLLREINKLNIGPMGLGGRTTCLGVNILTYPTHIAGLPVAVNISCHALRSAQAII